MPRVHCMMLLLLLFGQASTCCAQTINSKVVTYLQSKLGERIGGGECAHVASEALRVAGAEFLNSQIGADSPAEGDYVWGKLQKVVAIKDGKWTDSNPTTKLLPGDVIQYRNSKFVYPVVVDESKSVTVVTGNKTEITPHHTSIIAAVDSVGMPTSVYQQNLNDDRTLSKNTIDLSKLTDGFVRIYRPKARANSVGKIKYSIVNNTATPQTASIKVASSDSIGMITLGAANTGSSYMTSLLSTTDPAAKFRIVVEDGGPIVIANAAAYEIYTDSDKKAAIRRVTP